MNKIGALIKLNSDVCILEKMQGLREIGCECCQITVWDTSLYNDSVAEEILEAVRETGIEVSTLWAGWSGPKLWNPVSGPSTLGIVPEEFRETRTEEILKGAHFAKRIGVSRIATHAGFLPENMDDSRYPDVLATLRYIAEECAKIGVGFLFEAGQETPMALLRYIEEIGLDNVGINLDMANLIIYGKGNTADAVTVFGKYVRDTHVKDALYPTSGKVLGSEVKLGLGMANVSEVIRRLKDVGFSGNYVIEREISGEEQTRDIIDAVAYLKKILKTN